MASIDLLEELKLKDYYQQRLSFSEAIKLRGEGQNGCPKKYGLEIVRRLLMFDSTAVVSVTSEINEHLNNTNNTETETNVQSVSDGIRPPRRINVRLSRSSDNAQPAERRLHPMDLLVVVMNCCDDFLRQVLVEKMFANKLSIPILLPGVKNDSCTLLLLALRSLFPEIREGSACLTDTLIDVRNPVVSFIRIGKLHRSKSKLVNDLLNINCFNTFFHRECENGSAKRLLSNGSIEAAWFQSQTASVKEFNCRLFAALNLRGDARDYPKQTQFLCQSSTLVVFMVDSFEKFKELYQNVLSDVDESQIKIVVCYISPQSPDELDDKYFQFLGELRDRGVIFGVKYDWNYEEKMSDVDFTNDLREMISQLFRPSHEESDRMPTYANIIKSGKTLGFLLDEGKLEYELGKASADAFVDLVLKQPEDCKPVILPLQGEPWKEIGKLEREQRRKSQDIDQDEYFVEDKETEKRQQREIQCRSIIKKNEIALAFSLQFHILQGQSLLYYLNSCKIKLDARSRVVTSKLLEEYKKEKQKYSEQLPNEGAPRVKLSQMELKIENSTIGLEHILRECGQMYEAVISEEIHMKEELKKTPLMPDVIHNFPAVVARLLLEGQPLELMDGDASNVPIIWLKAVLDQVTLMTNNAKVFVLSIIGVQSSGKSTLLNALFGLKFPVSAGRCTRGIYCHLVPVDKEILHAEYDYVLVVDTEGLGASEFMENSTFKDNELATFAIGVADATIINLKGENWAEMKDILQVVAHGLIRVRKTKSELELMPRCMFAHQNVPAADAEQKNRLGQEKRLIHLDKAINAAGRAEGFTDINKFDQVIKYDPNLHSWYFPDLWNGTPPKARINQDYIGKANELRQNLMQLMRISPSKLTISGFFLRMSDLWNAMLHNDFVLCFRNTQEIISGTFLNDRISHEVFRFKNLNKPEQTKIRELICSFVSVQELRAEKEKILRKVRDAVENNFTNMKTTLQEVIDATDCCIALKQKYEISLNVLKGGELRRINDETTKDISVHMKKLDIGNDRRVKNLKVKLTDLEKRTEDVEKDKLSEVEVKEFEERWHHLIYDNKMLVDERMKIVENEIAEAIRGSIQKLSLKDTVQLNTVDWAEIFKTPLVDEIPQVTENDIVQNEDVGVMDFMPVTSQNINKANRMLAEAGKKWDLEFQNKRGYEFDSSLLNQVTLAVGQLLGILKKEHESRAEPDEICSTLPPGYSYTRDYIVKFIKFVCHYAYNRSHENNEIFITMTDPLADIGERYLSSVIHYRQISAEANIDAVSQQIFDYAKSSFVRNLGELIKTKVCKEENEHPTFKYKRAFLRTILTDLGQKTHNLTHVNEEKQTIFEEFMLYVELGESKASEDFFVDVILKLLKEMLTKECGNASETDFQKMVENNVGSIIKISRNALRQAEKDCKGRIKEYIRIFKEYMNIGNAIDFRISILDGFTEEVLEKIDKLYADFLRKSNSSFETLVSEDNRAGIRPLFEKIMGCRERCPFCSAPCSQSLEKHVGGHRAIHYPTGVSGIVDCRGWLTNTQETHDATKEEQRKPRKLSVDTCQTMVRSPINIRTMETVQKYSKWYHYWFNWNYKSFKNYKEVAEYANWDIPYSGDPKTSLFWKWFMAQFVTELAEHYKALCPLIPETWNKVTWEEAKESLYELDLTLHHPATQLCPIPLQSRFLPSLSQYLPQFLQNIEIPFLRRHLPQFVQPIHIPQCTSTLAQTSPSSASGSSTDHTIGFPFQTEASHLQEFLPQSIRSAFQAFSSSMNPP